eukprot:m51a1_g6802 putative cysteine proteinase rd19a (394) ;mRNA; r:240354-242111
MHSGPVVVALCWLALLALSCDKHCQFDKFKREFGRVYSSPEEEAKRFAFFSAKLDKIARLNAEMPSATFGVNQFSDLSETEFRATYLNNRVAEMFRNVETSPAPIVPSFKRTDIPESYKSPYTTPVQNQGSCGSCWAFSTMGVVEAAWKKATGTTEHFAPQMLVDCNLGGTCDGGWPNTALDYLVKYTKQGGGAMRESDYAYTGRDGTCKYKASKGVGKIDSYFSVKFNEATGGIDASLIKYGPLSICLGANSLDSYQSGILTDSYLCRQEVNHACGSCSSGQVCQSDGTCKTVNQLDWSEVPTPTEEYFTQTTFNSNTWLKTSGDSDTDRFMAWGSSSSLASATWTSFSAHTLAQSSGTIGLGMRMGQKDNVADGIYFKVVLSSSGSASLYL